MRETVIVVYELKFMDGKGEEYETAFGKTFDKELYEEDVDSTDMLMINTKLQDLGYKYNSELLLVEFTVAREYKI